MQVVADSPKYLGAELGMLGVLHTWGRQLIYHPHVHYVVAGAGLSSDQLRWVPLKDPGYFLPQQVLARRFRYRDSEEGNWHCLSVSAEEFLQRFLQHVLPCGFQRVRYYGWWSAPVKARWERILALLDWRVSLVPKPAPAPPPLCRHCQQPMLWVRHLPRAPP